MTHHICNLSISASSQTWVRSRLMGLLVCFDHQMGELFTYPARVSMTSVPLEGMNTVCRPSENDLDLENGADSRQVSIGDSDIDR